MTSPQAVAAIVTLAANSQILHYHWADRGRAPAGYIKGLAVMFGRCYCKLKAQDQAAVDMARAATGNTHTDALSWYAHQFSALQMDNSVAGPDTLRHVFVLLTGLGMRESSGSHCEGRDTSADNTAHDTAEAGLFQVSYNSIGESPILPELYAAYQGSTDFVQVFHEGVSCTPAQLKDWGEGAGVAFQHLTKACPAFAVEYAGVALRHVRTHWGPINTRAAELKQECDDLFLAVQSLIDNQNIDQV